VTTHADPDPPGPLRLLNSTNSSLTVAWSQFGGADSYTVTVNGTTTSDVHFSGVGDASVTAYIYNLQSGAMYCLNVAAVSYNLSSAPTEGCDFVTSE
jgi:hypothetical protein